MVRRKKLQESCREKKKSCRKLKESERKVEGKGSEGNWRKKKQFKYFKFMFRK